MLLRKNAKLCRTLHARARKRERERENYINKVIDK